MLIWRGWGIIVPFIAISLWLMLQGLFESMMAPEAYTEYSIYISAFSFLLGGLVIWILGKKLNGGEGRKLLDENTGERVVLKVNHSLFFINFEYWAIPLVIIAILLLFR
ncbi:MAG: hypothetical protein KBT53_07870 [Porticoccus sp.]|nr:hypothetical protein [Porticoccus sp.]MBQ0808374.1 hypothetical protein [Porticoccus sp.]